MTARDTLCALRWALGPASVREALACTPIALAKMASGRLRIAADLAPRIRQLALETGVVDAAGHVACRYCRHREPLDFGWDVAAEAMRCHEALAHVPPPVDPILDDPYRVRTIVGLVRDLVQLPTYAHRARADLHRRLRMAMCQGGPPLG